MYAFEQKTPLPTEVDVLIVGGGINGVGIARDLAGRGYTVLLAEAQDLAAHTSSSSSKLIHGGLRYLEYAEFSLVRKALLEREVLLNSAPHIMWPLRFVMPHAEAMRPAWMIRLGLFLYDHLARRKRLPASRGIDLRTHPAGAPLRPEYTHGFEYSDGWVDDARLVVLNALDAQAKGATILTRSTVIAALRQAQHWVVSIVQAQVTRQVRARVLVNAAGPWAEQFLRDIVQAAEGKTKGENLARRQLRLVKGSHIIVPRCFSHPYAYIFQNPDKRILFALPYEQDFTLIGTTDVALDQAELRAMHVLDKAHISAAEVDYFCTQASRYFSLAISPAQVVWSYAGVRPLLDDASGDPAAVTRDYLLETNQAAAPLLTVWGGKITTFRKLAEDAGDQIGVMLSVHIPAWSKGAFLPGGDFSAWLERSTEADAFTRFVQVVIQRYPILPIDLAQRYARLYGTRVEQLMTYLTQPDDLGVEVAAGLYEFELRYLHAQEWANSAEDVLWRRTKLGLHLSAEQQAAVLLWWVKNLG